MECLIIDSYMLHMLTLLHRRWKRRGQWVRVPQQKLQWQEHYSGICDRWTGNVV